MTPTPIIYAHMGDTHTLKVEAISDTKHKLTCMKDGDIILGVYGTPESIRDAYEHLLWELGSVSKR